jgi:peptide deformylase
LGNVYGAGSVPEKPKVAKIATLQAFTPMALLPILRFPDPKLHTVAKPVQAVDARIKKLVGDMLETMYEADGIGLAATQVDVHERVVVIDVSEQRDQPLVLINPEITWASAEKQVSDEGCLSVPGIYGLHRFGHGMQLGIGENENRKKCHVNKTGGKRSPGVAIFATFGFSGTSRTP